MRLWIRAQTYCGYSMYTVVFPKLFFLCKIYLLFFFFVVFMSISNKLYTFVVVTNILCYVQCWCIVGDLLAVHCGLTSAQRLSVSSIICHSAIVS